MTSPASRPLLTDVLAAHTPTPASQAGAVEERWIRAMRRLPDAARRSVADVRQLLAVAPARPAVIEILANALARSNDQSVTDMRTRLAHSRVPRATRGTWHAIHAAVGDPEAAVASWATDALQHAMPTNLVSGSRPITAVRLATSWALLTAAAHRTQEGVAAVLADASDDLRRVAMAAGSAPPRAADAGASNGVLRRARLYASEPAATMRVTRPREF
jgi:hypothetical protein